MHEVLDGIVQKGRERGASAGLRALRLQVGMARGEVVEMGGDPVWVAEGHRVLYHAALALRPEERAEYLGKACQHSVEMLREVFTQLSIIEDFTVEGDECGSTF